MRRLATRLANGLGSIGLSCVLLVLLGLLTWLGTLEQVESGLFQVQAKYFESFVLVHDAFGVPIPLPGANLVLSLLFVNLMVGGLLRLRRGWATAGVLVTHVGIALLLLSGFVKLYFSQDGHVTLFESQRANWFQSYYRWELVVARRLADGSLEERLLPQEELVDASGDARLLVSDAALPFDLELSGFVANCRPLPKGPMFDVDVPVVDGLFLRAEETRPEAESNIAGAYVRVLPRGGGAPLDGILWGLDRGPLTFALADETWAVELRKERYPMPFTLVLDEFTKVDHPRSTMPKSFASDVRVVEQSGERAVEISMNEPLRDGGLVLYQASWGPASARPGDPLFSTFSVVQNPADQLPLVGCVVSALGLLVHFSRKLLRHVRLAGRRP